MTRGSHSRFFSAWTRADMHTHARTRDCAYVHVLMYVYFIGNSLSRPNSLSHVRSPRRSISQTPLTFLLLRDPFLLGTEWATKRFSFARGASEVSHERSCATNSLQPKYFLSRTARQIEKTK